MSQAPSKAKK